MGAKKGRHLEGMEWLRSHIGHTGDDCLIFPLRAHCRGYPLVSCGNGYRPLASRLMCEWVNGPPPTPKHEAAHSCGKGHLGCVHPKHLSWKTRAENQRDRRQHGTTMNGIEPKLTPKDVIEIRSMKGKLNMEEIGRRYNVSGTNISLVLKRKTWARIALGEEAQEKQPVGQK